MTLNILKAGVVFFTVLQCTRAWTLKGYKGSFDNSLEVSWTNATQLIDEGYVNVEGMTVFYAFGFRGSETTQGSDKFIKATLSNTDWSVVLINWKEEAEPNGLPDYVTAARNTEIVGAELGQAISTMVPRGLDPNKTALVGLSLGGQLCGTAGFTVQSIIGLRLLWIVALDAARPLFEPKVNRCIKSTDATVTLLLHTDWNRFGVSGSYGTHDFFANPISYGLLNHQPGCSVFETVLNPVLSFQELNLTSAAFCSHRRAVELWIEIIEQNCTVIGNQARSATAWAFRNGSPVNLTCLNYSLTSSPQGNFYFRTNAQPTFGKKEAGTTP